MKTKPENKVYSGKLLKKGMEKAYNKGRQEQKKYINKLIDERMTDIELCYIDDPDNCADDDERWIILRELKSKINGKNKNED